MKRCLCKKKVNKIIKCIFKTIYIYYISLFYSFIFWNIRKKKYSFDKKKKTVFVGVSGGVDSSVSALKLKEQYNTIGVFIKVYQPEVVTFCWRNELLDAKKVCKQLKIPFIFLNLEKEYKKNIFDYMIDYYKRGLTPNPDVFCNKFIKFGSFLEAALKNGADYVATGHYAQNIFNAKENKFELKRGLDASKDQSYFLSSINQEKLSKTIFPIGNIEKKQVRKIAEEYNLITAKKKDSQGLCFVGKVNMRDFLKQYLKEEKGFVLNTKGQKIGQHQGSAFYTIGERHGFNIFKEFKTPNTPKLFVLEKNMRENTITVAPKIINQQKVLDKKEIFIQNLNLISVKKIEKETVYQTMIRYRGRVVDSKIEKIDNNKYKVIFNKPQTAISAGQILVIYKDDICLGQGEII